MKFVPFDDVIAQLEAINDTDENPSRPLFWIEPSSRDTRRPAGDVFAILRSAQRAGAFRSSHLQGLEDGIKFIETEGGPINFFDYIHKATGDNLMAEKPGPASTVARRRPPALFPRYRRESKSSSCFAARMSPASARCINFSAKRSIAA